MFQVGKKRVLSICFVGIVFGCGGIVAYKWAYMRPIATMQLFISRGHTPVIEFLPDPHPRYVLIDTGQESPLCLKQSLMKDLSLRATDKTRHSFTVLGEVQNRVFRLESLDVQGLHFENVEVDEKEKNMKIEGLSFLCHVAHPHMKYEGSIGMGLLGQYNFLLDFDRFALILYRKGVLVRSLWENSHVKIPLISNALPIIDLDTPYGRKRFLIDTGATVSLIAEELFVDFAPDILDDGTVKSIQLPLSCEGTSLGVLKCFFMKMSIKNLEADGILGLDFLHRYRLFFDNRHHYLYLMEYPEKTKNMIYTERKK